MTQIGLRATGYSADDFDWSKRQGVRVVPAEECWYHSLNPLMEEVQETVIGKLSKTYLFIIRRPECTT